MSTTTNVFIQKEERYYQYSAKDSLSGTVKTLYNSKILYNTSSICTKVPFYLEFEFITTEI